MSNFNNIKVENLLRSFELFNNNNVLLKNLNDTISDSNKKTQHLFNNLGNSITGISAGIKVLNQNINDSSKNLVEFKNKIQQHSNADWPGPKNWRPESHDPNRIVVRAVPPPYPNLSPSDKTFNYATAIAGAFPGMALWTYALSQSKNLIQYLEKKDRGEDAKLDTKAITTDTFMTMIGTIGGIVGNVISTYYGIVSADGIRPEDYFTKDTYSRKPLGDLSSSTSNALLTKNQQLKDSKETQNAVNWFIDRERLINELQAPYKNKSRKELKDIDNAFTETLKEKFEPEAHKGGIPKKKTKKVYQQKIGDYRRFNGAAGQNSHFEEEELGEEISETANYATQKPKLGNSKKVTNPEKAFEAIFNKKNIGMMKVFDETIQGVGQNIGSFFTGLAQGNPDAFKNFFLYPDNFYIA